jgi:hypothetical protein
MPLTGGFLSPVTHAIYPSYFYTYSYFKIIITDCVYEKKNSLIREIKHYLFVNPVRATALHMRSLIYPCIL